MNCPADEHRDERKGKKDAEEPKTRVAVLAAESHLIVTDIRTCGRRGNRHVVIEVTVVKLLELLNHVFLRCSLHLKESNQRC